MKLIIDISEEDFEWIQTHKSVTDYQITQMLYKRVLNGTPLDDVKAKIKEMPTDYCGGYIGLDKNEVLEILDNVGKEEREDVL